MLQRCSTLVCICLLLLLLPRGPVAALLCVLVSASGVAAALACSRGSAIAFASPGRWVHHRRWPGKMSDKFGRDEPFCSGVPATPCWTFGHHPGEQFLGTVVSGVGFRCGVRVVGPRDSKSRLRSRGACLSVSESSVTSLGCAEDNETRPVLLSRLARYPSTWAGSYAYRAQ